MLIDIKTGTEHNVQMPDDTLLTIECKEKEATVTHWSKEYTSVTDIKARVILNQFTTALNQ